MATFAPRFEAILRSKGAHQTERDRWGRRIVSVDDMMFVEFRPGLVPVPVEMTNDKWPDGNVPYCFDSSVSADNRSIFKESARLWEQRSLLNFIELAQQPDPKESFVLVISNAEKNSATVGRAGGQQNIHIRDWLPIVIAHEIGHTLGLIHEHERADRELYVDILKENIKSEKHYEENFQDLGIAGDGPYDFASIMHYPLDAFSKDEKRKLPTIRVREEHSAKAYLCGQRKWISHWDRLAMIRRYGAGPFVSLTRIDARQWINTNPELKESLPPMSDAKHGAVYVDLACPGPELIKRVVLRTSSANPGDVDIFVRRYAIRTESDWTADEVEFGNPRRSFKSKTSEGSNHTLTILNGPTGAPAVRYLIMLWAFRAYENVTFTVELLPR
jgi:astacin (peptidase family M12A)